MRDLSAHSVNSRASAWYKGAPPRHPAETIACPACGALVGDPCVSMLGGLGTAAELATRSPIRGLHVERIRASEAAS